MSISFSAQQSVGHYENFPVASWILPERYRPSVMALYRFARTADDIADEGDATPYERLQALSAMLESFEQHLHRQPLPAQEDPWHATTAPMAALCQTGLPAEYPRALISAFSQDVTTFRYQHWSGIMDYAARSANPIGRCLLYFFDRHHESALKMSDAICSALQFINFWQDVAIDWRKNRIYIPSEFLSANGLSIEGEEIARFSAGAPINVAWTTLMQHLVGISKNLLLEGRALPKIIGGRAGFELAVMMEGGLRILEKTTAVNGDVFRYRPKLGKADWALMLLRAARHY